MSWLKRLIGKTRKNAVPSLSDTSVSVDDLVPAWKPDCDRDLERIATLCTHFTNGATSFVVFSHGTCVIMDSPVNEEEAFQTASQHLSLFLKSHPDVQPLAMNDGSVLVQSLNVSAVSIVPPETLASYQSQIEENHLSAIPGHEVIMTPNGPNVFDDFGKQVLFARAFIFWDAQDLRPTKFVRPTTVA